MNRTHRTLTPEVLAKIRGAREATADKTVKILRCPYCNHRVSDAFAGATGCIRAKCPSCKRETVIDLVSWRRMRVSH
ncbi:MAG: hypothetical protein LBT36_05510 [Oscillospiraceae bacterium]|jgi:DNA-directed RNA polymerase subunit RPC12/RpoP|nr:hypothetical protein [Oscillospiraceae bacterium]